MCKSNCITIGRTSRVALQSDGTNTGMSSYEISKSGWGAQMIIGAFIMPQNDLGTAISSGGKTLVNDYVLDMAFLEISAGSGSRKDGVIVKIPLRALLSGECCHRCLKLGDCTQIGTVKILFPNGIDPTSINDAKGDPIAEKGQEIEIHWQLADNAHDVGMGGCTCGK